VRPLSASAHLRNIVVGGRKMLLLYAPHQLMYLITFKVYVYIYSCIYCIIRSL
jgi:hypothetical protein